MRKNDAAAMSHSSTPLSYDDLAGHLLEFIGAPAPEGFSQLALEIHRFQRRHNLPYCRFCESLGAPDPTDWKEIPAVPLSAFKHAALRSFPETETQITFRTSGTTGEGFGQHFFRMPELYDTSILAAWDRLGLPSLPHWALILPPAAAPFSSLSHMVGVLEARAAGSQAFFLSPEGRLQFPPLLAAAEEAREPVLMLGTALAYLALFEELARAGKKLALPRGSLALETGGYKGSGRSLSKAGLYAQFREFLQLEPESILNEYSMTELSSQFYARGVNGLHHGPPWARTLVIDPETGAEAAPGTIGTLRIFDLANLGSVLAVQTQDLAVERGDGFELIGRDPAALPRGCSRAADEALRR